MNEEQYYSPIIQAMMHTAQLQKQGAQQEIEKQRNADEKKLREQQLKQAQQQIDQAHEHQLKQHDIAEQTLQIHRQQADMEAELNRFHAMKAAQEVLSGAKPGFQLPPGLAKTLQGGGQQFQPQQSRQLPVELGGDQQQPTEIPQTAPQADLSGLFDPEAKGRQELAFARAKAEGALPSEKSLLDYKTESEKKLIGLKQDFELGENAKDRALKLQMNNADNATRLKLTGMGLGGENSPATRAMVIGGMTGDVDLDGSNPIEKAAMGSILEAGAKPVGKKDVGVLQQAQRLSPLFAKLEAFADKLPEDKGMAAANKAYQGIANKLFTTDLMNEFNQLKSQLINTGKTLEGMTGGRVSVLQMQTDLDSYASLGVTKKQMKDRIQNLKDYYKNNVDELVYKGTSPSQRQLLYSRKGVLPAYILFAPQTHPGTSNAKLDVEESLRVGKPQYEVK